jgi:tRNA U34 5-carboxymethylaminomethyl modifying enzyme MnmG/GidA
VAPLLSHTLVSYSHCRYEEAASLGIVAGANAGIACRDGAPLIIERHEGYVGVLVDDLVSLRAI